MYNTHTHTLFLFSWLSVVVFLGWAPSHKREPLGFGAGFLQAGCPCHLTDSVKALKGTQSTEP